MRSSSGWPGTAPPVASWSSRRPWRRGTPEGDVRKRRRAAASAGAIWDDAGHRGDVTGGPDVEAQIRAAQARGDFDDLPGKGKPLKLPEVHDPNWWIKSK